MVGRVHNADPLTDLPVLDTSDAASVSKIRGTLLRNKHLFNRDWLSDAALLVGPDDCQRLIPIHTQIVSPASEPFAAMFSDHWNKDAAPVRIPDYEATVVLSALRWIYCDELYCLKSDWEQLLLFACQFLMESLKEVLTNDVSLNSSLIWPTLSLAVKLDCKPLMRKCKDFVALPTKQLLSSASFMKQSADVVTAVTLMPELNIREYKLFSHCLSWAKEECTRNKLEPTPDHLRSLMEPFIKNIAFSTMSYQELVQVGRTGILTDQERLLVYEAKEEPTMPLPFSTTTRVLTSDKMRLKATLRLKIDNLSNLSRQLSEPTYVCLMPWRIDAAKGTQESTNGNPVKQTLRMFLFCDGDSDDDTWSCRAKAQFRLMPQRQGVQPFVRKFVDWHVFNASSRSWGFACFYDWTDILDPGKGWIMKDSVILEVELSTEQPQRWPNNGCLDVTGRMVDHDSDSGCLRQFLSFIPFAWSKSLAAVASLRSRWM